ASGREHRVEDDRGARVQVVGEAVDVRLGLQGRVVARDADDADLGVRDRVEHALEHAEPGAQDRHDGHLLAAQARHVDRPAPALDANGLERKVGGRLVRQEPAELGGDLAKALRREALFAQQPDLVAHQRMLELDHRHRRQPSFAAIRWRTASYRQTPLATETLRLSTAPRIGTLTSSSHVRATSWRMPRPSAPRTNATGPRRL